MKIFSGDNKFIWMTFLGAFFAIPLADQLSGILVYATYQISGLSGLIAHSVVGALYGFLVNRYARHVANKILLILPVSMLVAGLFRSIYFFLVDDRVFHFDEWISYILTSKFGFNWLLVLPLSAYLVYRRLNRVKNR